MARLTTPSGWGTLRDPETGDRVPLTEEIDDDVAARLAAEYDGVAVEGGGDVDDADGDDHSDLADASREDLEAADYAALRQIASERDDLDVDGRSTKADIIDALTDD